MSDKAGTKKGKAQPAKKKVVQLTFEELHASKSAWADEPGDDDNDHDVQDDVRPGDTYDYDRVSSRESRDYGDYPQEIAPEDMPTEAPYKAYLGNLSFDVTRDDIHDFFRGCRIVDVHIVYDREANRPKGFGYVEFDTLDDLKDAFKLNGESLAGRPLRIGVAKATERDRERAARRSEYRRDDRRDDRRDRRYGGFSGDRGEREEKPSDLDNDWRARKPVEGEDEAKSSAFKNYRSSRYDDERDGDRARSDDRDRGSRYGGSRYGGSSRFSSSSSRYGRDDRDRDTYDRERRYSPAGRRDGGRDEEPRRDRSRSRSPVRSAAVEEKAPAPRAPKPNPFGEARAVNTTPEEILKKREEERKKAQEERKKAQEAAAAATQPASPSDSKPAPKTGDERRENRGTRDSRDKRQSGKDEPKREGASSSNDWRKDSETHKATSPSASSSRASKPAGKSDQKKADQKKVEEKKTEEKKPEEKKTEEKKAAPAASTTKPKAAPKSVNAWAALAGQKS